MERGCGGGREALLKGSVKRIGDPIPLGTVLPLLGETGTPIDSLRGAKPAWNEECVTGILCTQDKAVVAALPGLTVLKTPSVTEYYWGYDGASWSLKTKDHAAFTNTSKKIIGFKLGENCGFAAASFVHEVRHTTQPQNWTIVEKEKDAYTFEEQFTIDRGIPGRPGFREPKPGGGEQVKTSPVTPHPAAKYTTPTSTAGEEITRHRADHKAENTQAH